MNNKTEVSNEENSNGRCTKEFREEAVKLVTEEGLSTPEAAQRLSLPKSTLATWVKASKTGKIADIGKHQRQLTETGKAKKRAYHKIDAICFLNPQNIKVNHV